MKTKPDDSAFNGTNATTQVGKDTGLAKREYFAGLAMQAICTHATARERFEAQKTISNAVVIADALIDALNDAPKYPTKEAIATFMENLSDGDRMEVMGEFCKYCGSSDPGCQCWNDE